MRFKLSAYDSALVLMASAFLTAQPGRASAPGAMTAQGFGGKACDIEHGFCAAYSEEHSEKIQDGKCLASHTLFKDLKGQTMAELHLDFAHFALMPEYVFKDLRNGYEEGSRVNGDEVHVYYRDSSHAVLHEKELKVPEPRVVNGGINSYIKERWKNLEAGERLDFNMVVPARLDYYRFIAYQDTALTLSKKEAAGRDCMAVIIEPKSTILKMVLSPIVINFDRTNMRVVRYQGIVNIADAKGRSLRVRVDYPGLGP